MNRSNYYLFSSTSFSSNFDIDDPLYPQKGPKKRKQEQLNSSYDSCNCPLILLDTQPNYLNTCQDEQSHQGHSQAYTYSGYTANPDNTEHQEIKTQQFEKNAEIENEKPA